MNTFIELKIELTCKSNNFTHKILNLVPNGSMVNLSYTFTEI